MQIKLSFKNGIVCIHYSVPSLFCVLPYADFFSAVLHDLFFCIADCVLHHNWL